MNKSQLTNKKPTHRKNRRGKRVAAINYKKTERRKAAELIAAQDMEQRLKKQVAFHIEDWADYDPLWHINRKNPITLIT